MPRLKDVRNYFESLTIIVYCRMKIREKMLSSTKKSTKDLTSMTFINDIELIKLSTTPVFLKQYKNKC